MDRRRSLRIDVAPTVDRRVGLAAAVALVAWCVLCAAVSRDWPQAGGQLFEDARGCTAVLFLTAGLLRLAHWRVDGQAPAGLTGAAFVTLGSAQAVLTFASPVLSSDGRVLASPVFTLATLSAVVVLLLAARSLPAVRADL
ncbi:MAG TPA: hypothetical protein VHO01_05860, partial [Jatrophihabitans sp.]|nr:hypothetical protein [Jatrophihabitans sp.]